MEEAEYLAILHQGKNIVEDTLQHVKEMFPHLRNLHFANEEEANQAMQLLIQKGMKVDGIQPNLPTLEEVFLRFVEEKEEVKKDV